MKSREDCVLALALGCTLVESTKGNTVTLINGVQVKSNKLRRHPSRDYKFSTPSAWSIQTYSLKYLILKYLFII
jgi:hypothetical protein